jgi:hypothetical protein
MEIAIASKPIMTIRHIFFTKKTLWIPTLWCWLLLSVLGVGACTLLVQQAYPFLAAEEPSGAKLLVIEGWMAPTELDQALIRFQLGGYRRAVTTGGPIPISLSHNASTSFAKLARDYLIQKGLPEASVIALPAPASARDRTYLSAVTVREWLKGSVEPVDAIDVLSEGVHSRRTRLLYQIAFGGTVNIGILTAVPEHYDPSAWWRSSVGTKIVLSEAIGWAWTSLFFDPGPIGSREEMWAIKPQESTSAKSSQ